MVLISDTRETLLHKGLCGEIEKERGQNKHRTIQMTWGQGEGLFPDPLAQDAALTSFLLWPSEPVL